MPFDAAGFSPLTADQAKELETLIRARALIEDPKNWSRKVPQAPTIAPYCAMTACLTAAGYSQGYLPSSYPKSLWRLAAALPTAEIGICMSIANFNDHPDTSHADILALFDRAIAEIEEH